MNLWNVELDCYNNDNIKKYETIFVLANGYKGLRGSLEFSKLGTRGNLIAGIFDKAQAQVTEIVNCQDPLGFNIYINNELVDMEHCTVNSFRRVLNMKKAVLTTELVITTPLGNTVEINSERYVSKSNVHRWASKYEITPKNFNGKVFIENYIDASVTNSADDVMSRTKHLSVMKAYDIKPGIALETQTIDKKVKIIEGTRLIGEDSRGNIFKARRYSELGEKVVEVYETFMRKESTVTIYKYGATYTDRDTNENLFCVVSKELDSFVRDGYEVEKIDHINAWDDVWNDIDIEINGDDKAQIGIRFSLFHLASSAYEEDEKVSIAAKGLHGEGYKGHVFWDTEVFMLPFFIYTRPKVAKALLMYRYNTLKGARENARLNGFKGARFPWEAADDGTEVTPKWGFDYEGNAVRFWTGDEEFHINSDISFGIIEYFRVTQDEEFLINFGIEILLDTAKFWQSRVEYNEDYDRYEINSVIGPDEFHEHIDNNAFTNYLAKWNLEKALYFKDWLKVKDENKLKILCNELCINEDDFENWTNISRKIYIPKSEDGTIIEQFQGFFDLDYIPITEYDQNSMPVWPKEAKLDRLGDTQLVKQADVVQLLLMLPEEFSYEMKKLNYEYYEQRTMHKSSLSPSMYSILGLAVGDTDNAYKYFMKTAYTDLEDNQGNTDSGLHGASTGGSWQSIVFGFVGLSIGIDGNLKLKPWIPLHWNSLKFSINWNNSKINFSIYQDHIDINSDDNCLISMGNKIYKIVKNCTVSIKN